jgi:hypothetical protein
MSQMGPDMKLVVYTPLEDNDSIRKMATLCSSSGVASKRQRRQGSERIETSRRSAR